MLASQRNGGEHLDTVASAEVPNSAIELSGEKKVDVLLSLMETTRNSILFWTERSFQATVWGIGVELAAAGSWILYGGSVPAGSKYFLVVALFLFGLLAQIYLQTARTAHLGNGLVVAKLEAALRLCDKGAYVENDRFFGYSGRWLTPTSITALQVLHAVVVVFSLAVVGFVRPAPGSGP